MSTLFTILQLVVSALLVFIVLVQEGKDPGMKGIAGSSPDTGDSFFSKNSGSTKQAFMNKITATLAVLFLITTMTLVMLAS